VGALIPVLKVNGLQAVSLIRFAISNQRLITVSDTSVAFRWKDYAHGSRQHTPANEKPVCARLFQFQDIDGNQFSTECIVTQPPEQRNPATDRHCNPAIKVIGAYKALFLLKAY
jgi:hypothetical protein